MALPINDEDMSYELDIAKNPDNIDAWLRYVEFKQHSPILERVFVYERACQRFGRSYKLWKGYLDLRVDHIKYVSCKKHADQYQQVYDLFEQALVLLNKMPRLWIDYLNLLTKSCPDVTKVRHTFDRALQSLPLAQHDRIWPLFLDFAVTVNPRTQSLIWSRYMQYDSSQVEDYVDVLIKSGDFSNACVILMKAIDDPDFESVKNKSRFNLWEDLIELLVHHDTLMDVEKIIESAIARYTDQFGRLKVHLATYWINQGNHDRARDVFEQGMTTAMTVRDFTQLFDSYVEFEETLIARMLEGEDPEADIRMESFELLMDRRPFLISDIMLKQDSNNVREWQKRVSLWQDNVDKVVETYTKAIETISPAKANGALSRLWIDYAQFYEKGNDIPTARILFDKATKVPYKSVNELADVWIEWAEMELRQGDLDRAINVMAASVVGPKKSTVDYFDETKPPQERLHKSMKVWSFYVDLVESGGDLEQVKPLYERMFELKIGTALTVLNYANLLEEHEYFEESFKVFEKGLALFTYPVAFELWNVYLNKAVKRKLGVERLRDLFEQALEGCPAKFSKSIYLLYGQFEEDRGLIRNAMRIFDQAVERVDTKDKLEMFKHYISRITAHQGLQSTRPVFQRAVEVLNDTDTNDICADFIAVETKLGEIERARAIYEFASQFNHPDTNANFWSNWEQFEIQYGNEVTYKEMLRIKRGVRQSLSNDVRHMAGGAAGALQREAHAAPGFVTASTDNQSQREVEDQDNDQEPDQAAAKNPDEIDIDI